MSNTTICCPRCKKELEADHAAKLRIIDEIFGADDPESKWYECDECWNRPYRKIQRWLSNLRDPIWWEYHSWYDFQRVVLRRKYPEFTLPLWWRD